MATLFDAVGGLFSAAGQNIANNLLKFQLENEALRAKRAQSRSAGTALSTLYGGYDPQTEVVWNSGRPGLTAPEQVGLLTRAFPTEVGKAQIERLFPGIVKPVAVPEGGALVDPRTGEVVYHRPKSDGITWGDTPATAPPAPSANLQSVLPQAVPAPTGVTAETRPPAAQPPGGRTIPTGPGKLAAGAAFAPGEPGAAAQGVPTIYQPYIQDASAAYGVDAGVLGRMLLTETAPGGRLTSKAGARGVMQFMGPTAQQYGVDVNDPASSIDGAGRMMQYLLKKYNGDYRLAVGAYNWGEGNVDRWLADGGDVSKVPPETLDYVRKTVGLQTNGPTDQSGTVTARPDGPATTPEGTTASPGDEGWQTGLQGGRPYTKDAEPGKQWARRQKGVNAAGQPVYEFKQVPIPGARDEQIAKERAEAEAKDAERKQKLIDAGVKDERDWRTEFRKPIEQATELTTQIGIVRDSLGRKNGTGDMAAIIAFNKLLDPGAVVREADVELTRNAQSVLDRLKTWAANKSEGDQLPQPLRDKIRELSEQIQRTSLAVLKDRVVPYRSAIEDNGGKWDRVVPPVLMQRFGWDVETPPQQPAPTAAMPAVDPDAARAELRRRGVIP